MNRGVYAFLSDYSTDPIYIDRLIVSAFLYSNRITINENELLKQYLIEESDTKEKAALSKFLLELSKTAKNGLSIEDLIELFEFVISPADKEVNGAVYTPKKIRDYIVNETIYKLESQGISMDEATYADIACGCSGFLYSVALEINQKTGKAFSSIYRDNLFGLDIEEYSIDRSKLLLSIAAVINGDEQSSYSFNFYHGDALKFDWSKHCLEIKKSGGFSSVIGNPPYVGAVKLKQETRDDLKTWNVANQGKADLYIPFFQIGLELLLPKGVLGYISVNSFYKSLNGRGLREYISSNHFKMAIVDFGGEQIFKGRRTYTCVCLIQNVKADSISYIKCPSKNLATLRQPQFVQINFDQLKNEEIWLLESVSKTMIIRAIENVGKPLGELYQIRNGFATLRNNIYIFKPISEDNYYYYFAKNGVEYKVEKQICKDAIKPNTLKSELEINNKIERIIFPYHTTDTPNNKTNQGARTIKLFDEDYFKYHFPHAYSYLEAHKIELAKRDNGNKEYENWFAFGRRQGLTLLGKKLLFPYIADNPYFVFTDNEDLLFYNGFAIISASEEKLKLLKLILNSKVFWFYVSHVSRPYENDYYSMGKRYIKKFGIPEFTETEKYQLINASGSQRITQILENKYGIRLPTK